MKTRERRQMNIELSMGGEILPICKWRAFSGGGAIVFNLDVNGSESKEIRRKRENEKNT